MFPDKSDLLEQINVDLIQKWSKKNGSNPAKQKSKKKINRITNSNYLTHFNNEDAIERLEQRVKCLESCNNQLIHLINSLIEYLPDLIASGLHADQESQTDCNNDECICAAEEEEQSPVCCQKEKVPCPTRREKDIIELLVKGFCAKEIANRLFISETTVVTHKKNLKEKFNAKNSVELISKVQHFLLREDEEK